MVKNIEDPNDKKEQGLDSLPNAVSLRLLDDLSEISSRSLVPEKVLEPPSERLIPAKTDIVKEVADQEQESAISTVKHFAGQTKDRSPEQEADKLILNASSPGERFHNYQQAARIYHSLVRNPKDNPLEDARLESKLGAIYAALGPDYAGNANAAFGNAYRIYAEHPPKDKNDLLPAACGYARQLLESRNGIDQALQIMDSVKRVSGKDNPSFLTVLGDTYKKNALPGGKADEESIQKAKAAYQAVLDDDSATDRQKINSLIGLADLDGGTYPLQRSVEVRNYLSQALVLQEKLYGQNSQKLKSLTERIVGELSLHNDRESKIEAINLRVRLLRMDEEKNGEGASVALCHDHLAQAYDKDLGEEDKSAFHRAQATRIWEEARHEFEYALVHSEAQASIANPQDARDLKIKLCNDRLAEMEGQMTPAEAFNNPLSAVIHARRAEFYAQSYFAAASNDPKAVEYLTGFRHDLRNTKIALLNYRENQENHQLRIVCEDAELLEAELRIPKEKSKVGKEDDPVYALREDMIDGILINKLEKYKNDSPDPKLGEFISRIAALYDRGTVDEGKALFVRETAYSLLVESGAKPEILLAEEIAIGQQKFAYEQPQAAANYFQKAFDRQNELGLPVEAQLPVLFLLGRAQKRAEDEEAAIKTYEKALELGRDKLSSEEKIERKFELIELYQSQMRELPSKEYCRFDYDYVLNPSAEQKTLLARAEKHARAALTDCNQLDKDAVGQHKRNCLSKLVLILANQGPETMPEEYAITKELLALIPEDESENRRFYKEKLPKLQLELYKSGKLEAAELIATAEEYAKEAPDFIVKENEEGEEHERINGPHVAQQLYLANVLNLTGNHERALAVIKTLMNREEEFYKNHKQHNFDKDDRLFLLAQTHEMMIPKAADEQSRLIQIKEAERLLLEVLSIGEDEKIRDIANYIKTKALGGLMQLHVKHKPEQSEEALRRWNEFSLTGFGNSSFRNLFEEKLEQLQTEQAPELKQVPYMIGLAESIYLPAETEKKVSLYMKTLDILERNKAPANEIEPIKARLATIYVSQPGLSELLQWRKHELSKEHASLRPEALARREEILGCQLSADPKTRMEADQYYNQALAHYREALSKSQSEKEEADLAMNIENLFGTMAYVAEDDQRYKDAIRYSKEQYRLKPDSEDNYGESDDEITASELSRLGNLQLKLADGEVIDALGAIETYSRLAVMESRDYNPQALARAYTAAGNFEQALAIYHKLLAGYGANMAVNNSEQPDSLAALYANTAQAYKGLSEQAEKLGAIEQAKEYQALVQKYSDGAMKIHKYYDIHGSGKIYSVMDLSLTHKNHPQKALEILQNCLAEEIDHINSCLDEYPRKRHVKAFCEALELQAVFYERTGQAKEAAAVRDRKRDLEKNNG